MEFLLSLKPMIDVAAEILMSLVVLATLLVRLPGLNSKTADVKKLDGLVLRGLHFLPTLGINPRTQALEAALQDALSKLPQNVPQTDPAVPPQPPQG